MDPVTRYQDALDELVEAAEGLLVPSVLQKLAPDLDRWARAGHVPPPVFVFHEEPDPAGDPLVP
jgi:hypothetical protein